MATYIWECTECGARRETICTISDRNKPQVCRCKHPMERIIVAPAIQPDITPYVAQGGDMAGQYITSRREHREFLRRNRFVEVGNEPIRPIKNDFRPKRGEIAQELKRVIPQVLKR